MAVLDPLFRLLSGTARGIGILLRGIGGLTEETVNAEIQGQRLSEIVGQSIEEAEPIGDSAAGLVDVVEEAILNDLQEAGRVDPDNVEDINDQVEGQATAVLLAGLLSSLGIEVAGLTQLDTQGEFILQAVSGLGLDESTGNELEVRMREGVVPALEQQANADHQSKVVNLNDRVEFLLRQKTDDLGYLRDAVSVQAGGFRLADPDADTDGNPMGVYGLDEDEVARIEETALNDMEFEELIETPAELGLVVPDDILDAELNRAGYAEPTKDFLRRVNNRLSRSARVYQELIRTEDLVSSLDTLVENGELDPQQAVNLFPDDTEVDPQALRDRFRLLQEPPTGPPTRSQIESSFARGYTDRQTLEDRLDRTSFTVGEYQDVIRTTVLEELDGDLQESVALGLVSEGRFSDLAEFAGVDDEAIELLLQGASFADIASRRLTQTDTAGDRGLRTISGIGESRAALLRDVGLETVAELAQVDPEELADAAGLAIETTDRLVTRAQARVSQGSL